MDGPDLDALFGPEDDVVQASPPLAADDGLGAPAAALAPAPHPALLHAVLALLDSSWPRAAKELAAATSESVVQEASPAKRQALSREGAVDADKEGADVAGGAGAGAAGDTAAARLESAMAAARSTPYEWPVCRAAAQAASALAWERFERAPRGWPRVCDRELFMLAELLAALGAAAAGDAATAVLAADRVFVFAGAGGFRDAAVLFARLLDGEARRQRPSEGPAAATLGAAAAFGAALPSWARPAAPAGSACAKRFSPEASADTAALQGALLAGRPLVAEGLLEAWPARSRWRSLAHLDAVAGHRIVPLELGAEVGSADWREELMPLGRFLREHLAPSCECFWGEDASTPGASTRPLGGVAYLAQHELLEQCPDLRAEVSVPEAWRRALGAPTRSNVWLGTHGTVTPCHWDSYSNCLAQVQGAKRVFLLPPEASPFLSLAGAGDVAGTAAQGNVSAVDVERDHALGGVRAGIGADQEAPRVVVADLMPGDALFIPQGWWHQVRALSPSLSVNFWF